MLGQFQRGAHGGALRGIADRFEFRTDAPRNHVDAFFVGAFDVAQHGFLAGDAGNDHAPRDFDAARDHALLHLRASRRAEKWMRQRDRVVNRHDRRLGQHERQCVRRAVQQVALIGVHGVLQAEVAPHRPHAAPAPGKPGLANDQAWIGGRRCVFRRCERRAFEIARHVQHDFVLRKVLSQPRDETRQRALNAGVVPKQMQTVNANAQSKVLSAES